jgi:surfactin synthase thioesterase subunit
LAGRFTLIVFPHAGGSAGAYRELTRHLQPHFEVHCVELPGHGRLRHQPFLGDMRQIVDFAHGQAQTAAASGPVAFLGHSMGAWIAFLVAARANGARPEHLVLSAARPPHLGVHRKLLGLEPDTFVRELGRLGGVPAELAADRDALELFLPALRADLQLLEPYQPPRGQPIDIPITVLRAAADDISSVDAAAWSETTTAACNVHTLPGGHFFLFDQPELVTAVLRRALAKAA